MADYYVKVSDENDFQLPQVVVDNAPFAKSDDLADVATSGDYDDLEGKPSIPSTPGAVGAEPSGLSDTTKASLNDTYGADAVSNPETAMNDAVSQVAAGVIPTIANLPYEFFIGASPAAARPTWAGPVTWVTTVDVKPLNAIAGDSYRVVSAEPAPWAPSDITGLMGWYEPSDLTDGSTVASWLDRSQYGRTLTAAGAPIADADGMNGTPCVTLDGASGLVSPSFTQQDNNGPITVFANAQFGALGSGGLKQLLVNGQNSVNPSLAIIRGDNPSTSSAKNRWGYGRASSAVYATAQSADQLVHRFILSTDLANSKLSVDATDYALGTAGSAQITQFQIGQQGPSLGNMIGKVGTVFWMLGKPDTPTLAAAIAYLNARAGR